MTPMTPVLSDHARQRCAEMGISTKVAKRIVQQPTTVYPSSRWYPGQRRLVHSAAHPEFLVVIETESDPVQVVTVLWKSKEFLSREVANQQARERVS